MRKSLKVITAIIIILAVLFTIVYAISVKNRNALNTIEVKTAKVEKGDIVVLFSTSGDVESKAKQDYYILSPTKVLKTYVSLGDRIKKGERLLELETQDLSIQYQIAQKQLQIAKLQLESLKKLKEKQLSQSIGQNNSTATQSYSLPSGFSLPSQQDKAAFTSVGSSSSSLQSSSQSSLPNMALSQSQASFSLTNIDDQIKLQEKQVEIAELNLKSIKQSMDKQQKYITAQIDGVVTAINVKEGNLFSSVQLPAITVEDTNNLQIVLNVNQYDSINLKKGQKAYIKFGDKTFDGIVTSVSPAATKVLTQTGSENVVKVYVDILNNDRTIKPGFNVDVDIKIGEKSDAIKVPSEAIISDKYGNNYVYIVENNVAKQKKVKVGLSSDLETEVIDGVDVGQEVILNPNSSIQDGTEVRIKDVKSQND